MYTYWSIIFIKLFQIFQIKIEFPIDTLYPYHLIQREMGIKNEAGKSIAQKIINLYLTNYIESLFAGAFCKHDFSPLKPEITLASELQVKEAAEIISKAKKPVILIGSQATLPPVPAEKLRESLEVKFNIKGINFIFK